LEKVDGPGLVGARQAFLVHGYALFTRQRCAQAIGFDAALEALRRCLPQAVGPHGENGLEVAEAFGGLLGICIVHDVRPNETD
jgi:hypothetical protein